MREPWLKPWDLGVYGTIYPRFVGTADKQLIG